MTAPRSLMAGPRPASSSAGFAAGARPGQVPARSPANATSGMSPAIQKTAANPPVPATESPTIHMNAAPASAPLPPSSPVTADTRRSEEAQRKRRDS